MPVADPDVPPNRPRRVSAHHHPARTFPRDPPSDTSPARARSRVHRRDGAVARTAGALRKGSSRRWAWQEIDGGLADEEEARARADRARRWFVSFGEIGAVTWSFFCYDGGTAIQGTIEPVARHGHQVLVSVATPTPG